MISFQSEIEGKEAVFGEIVEPFAMEGFDLGGNWEYDGGYFDHALEQEGGETIYVRLPVEVTRGQLDDAQANLKFLRPLIVRHVVHTGIDDDVGSAGLMNQFQSPIEKDGDIYNEQQRIEKARQAIQRLLPYVH